MGTPDSTIVAAPDGTTLFTGCSRVVHSAATPRQRSATLRHCARAPREARSEEHTSELLSLMRSSYAVFCLKKKNTMVTNSHISNSCTHSPTYHYISTLHTTYTTHYLTP